MRQNVQTLHKNYVTSLDIAPSLTSFTSGQFLDQSTKVEWFAPLVCCGKNKQISKAVSHRHHHEHNYHDKRIFFAIIDLIFTARKRSLRKLCFYTCLSVILFTGGRGSTWAVTPWQVHPWQVHPPQAGTPPSRYPHRQVHPLGRYTPRQVHPLRQVHPPSQVHPPWQVPPPRTRGRYPPGAEAGTPPAQYMLGDTGNKWAVRILLECNLVFHVFS